MLSTSAFKFKLRRYTEVHYNSIYHIDAQI